MVLIINYNGILVHVIFNKLCELCEIIRQYIPICFFCFLFFKQTSNIAIIKPIILVKSPCVNGSIHLFHGSFSNVLPWTVYKHHELRIYHIIYIYTPSGYLT